MSFIEHNCPYQLANKCSKEAIYSKYLEKYFSALHIHQLFGYNKGKIQCSLFIGLFAEVKS